MSSPQSWKVEDMPAEKWGTSSYDAENLEYDFQSTLDTWRTYEIVDNGLEELDEELKEKYDGGVDFATIYGSTSANLTIFSDAVLPRSHQPGDKWYDDSDIDLLVGLERPSKDIDEKEYRREAAEILYESHDDVSEYPNPKLHPLVEMSDSLKQIFKEARHDWLRQGGETLEKINLKAQPNEDGVYEVSRYWQDIMRCMAEGASFSEKYQDETFYNEIREGINIITDGEGLRQDIDFESSGLPHYEGEPNRPDKLNRNMVYGLWERARRNSDLELPPIYNEQDPTKRVEERRQYQGQWPGKILAHGILNEEFADEELAEYFPGDITASKSEWVEEMSEEELENKKKKVQNAVEKHMDTINDFLPTEFFNDPDFSRRKIEQNPETFEDVENFIGRTARKDMPLEPFLAAELAVEKIKSKHEVLSENKDLDKEMYQYTLAELNEIEQEDQTQFGKDW